MISKSLMTPSFSGRMAVIEPGVLPSISLATRPTALPFCRTRLVPFLTATTLGSFRTMPSPLTQTSVLHVPRSMPMSMLNMPSRRSKITWRSSKIRSPAARPWPGRGGTSRTHSGYRPTGGGDKRKNEEHVAMCVTTRRRGVRGHGRRARDHARFRGSHSHSLADARGSAALAVSGPFFQNPMFEPHPTLRPDDDGSEHSARYAWTGYRKR